MAIMASGTQKAIFQRCNSFNTWQAAQEDTQKSQKQLYRVSLILQVGNSTHYLYQDECD